MKIADVIEWLSESEYVYRFLGDVESEIVGFSSLDKCQSGKLTWVKKKENYDKLENPSVVTLAVVQEGLELGIPNQIISDNSKAVFFGILERFFDSSRKEDEKAVGRNTYISDAVVIEENVQIGVNCVLDGNIRIGKGTRIEHNVTIMNDVSIGEDCIIHSGAVIGKDGFGFSFDNDNIPRKVKHFGGVVIGDRVEIGGNCTIDRGTIDSTVVGNDTKIDNLVQIAHNVEIGSGVLIVGCTDIAGSTKIGNKSYIGPQVCIKNQMSIGENSFVGMGVMVNEHIGDDEMIVNPTISKVSKNRNYRRFL